jgi:hypothetical protein
VKYSNSVFAATHRFVPCACDCAYGVMRFHIHDALKWLASTPTLFSAYDSNTVARIIQNPSLLSVRLHSFCQPSLLPVKNSMCHQTDSSLKAISLKSIKAKLAETIPTMFTMSTGTLCLSCVALVMIGSSGWGGWSVVAATAQTVLCDSAGVPWFRVQRRRVYWIRQKA